MPMRAPLNDPSCLPKLHDAVWAFIESPKAAELASQFKTAKDVVEYIRELDQRDDFGDPNDGPKLACDLSQRLRLPAPDPNCLERTALYLALVMLVEPDLDVTSATLRLDNGLHTFPVEIRDGVPRAVVLDPKTESLRNAMNAAAYQLRNVSPMADEHIGPWFTEMALKACVIDGIGDCYQRAMDAIRHSLITGEPLEHPDDIDCVLELAYRDAQLFGPAGRVAYRRVHQSLRNLSIGLDKKRVAKFLNTLVNAAEPLAADALKAALIAKFGPAAGIALQGVDLTVKEPGDADKDKDKGKDKDKDKDKNAQTASDHSKKNLTPEDRQRRLRRMVLAFRNH